jgi:hypothetical protein
MGLLPLELVTELLTIPLNVRVGQDRVASAPAPAFIREGQRFTRMASDF